MEPNKPQTPKFALGRIVVTPNALREIPNPEIFAALARHVRADWGECSPEDASENDFSVVNGYRIFSVYCSAADQMFWVITEADRSATTVLLPEDY